MKAYYLTDTGKVRSHNEDSVTILKNSNNEYLLIVADGMGGHNKGDYASKTAVRILKDLFFSKPRTASNRMWINKTVKFANTELYHEAYEDSNYEGMGTTLVFVLISNGKYYTVNLGDSRAYLFDGNHLKQLTEDQGYVEYLIKSGQITEEEAKSHPDKHVIMNALGIYPSTYFDLKVGKYTDNSNKTLYPYWEQVSQDVTITFNFADG